MRRTATRSPAPLCGRFHVLEHLDLNDNGMGTEAVSLILDSLACNRALRSLGLVQVALARVSSREDSDGSEIRK